MVRPYSKYKQSSFECKLLIGLSKYSNYIRRGLRCDIRNVKADDFIRIDRKAARLEGKIEKIE